MRDQSQISHTQNDLGYYSCIILHLPPCPHTPGNLGETQTALPGMRVCDGQGGPVAKTRCTVHRPRALGQTTAADGSHVAPACLWWPPPVPHGGDGEGPPGWDWRSHMRTTRSQYYYYYVSL